MDPLEPRTGPRTGPRTLLRPRGLHRRAPLAAVLAVAAGALALSSCSSDPHPAAAPMIRATTTTAPPPACPLTGAAMPGGGQIPARPALAVKVDNYPQARPQSGLDAADDIFEEPVEGGITRLVAIFQCRDTALVGPIRSARNIDVGILGQLGSPLLAHVGGIQPVLANIDHSPIIDVDLGAHGSIIQHVPGRYAPYDTYASTSALWATEPGHTTPPAPLFTYTAAPAAGSPVSGVHIPFSGTSDVWWHYDPTTAMFQRSYGTTPDLLSGGTQNQAANVIVQFVHVTYGPWLENSEGGLEVQANLYDDASGNAQVYRNGTEISGTWHRSSLAQPTAFVDASGQPIGLEPGVTWVELVPDTVTVTPLAPTAP